MIQETLQLIEAELVDLRSKYTEQDISIKRLLEKRELAISSLKKGQLTTSKQKDWRLKQKWKLL